MHRGNFWEMSIRQVFYADNARHILQSCQTLGIKSYVLQCRILTNSSIWTGSLMDFWKQPQEVPWNWKVKSVNTCPYHSLPFWKAEVVEAPQCLSVSITKIWIQFIVLLCIYQKIWCHEESWLAVYDMDSHCDTVSQVCVGICRGKNDIL